MQNSGLRRFRRNRLHSAARTNNQTVSFYQITKKILEHLGLPMDYGQYICSEHFLKSDIENNRLKSESVPSLLHFKSIKEHDHGYAAINILGKTST